jgi:ABC-2 type transport system ATP-binding protein
MAMTHLAIETERLRREYRFRGDRGRASTFVALDDVTLSVRRGEIFGLLGLNGAGKSTLLQVLATRLRPSSGSAKVAGFDVGRYGAWVRRHVGVVFSDELGGVPERLGIRPRQSTGLRQRERLARGFASSPTVLLLDQPTAGLDAAASRDVRTFIRRWTGDDRTRTVVLATNDVREASEVCDRVAILNAGRLVACDTPSALVKRLDPRLDLIARVKRAVTLEQVFLDTVGRGGPRTVRDYPEWAVARTNSPGNR